MFGDFVALGSQQALAEVMEKWLPRGPDEITDPAAAVPEKEGAVFDKAGAMERLMGDNDMLRMIVKGFLEDIPRQMGVLKGYLEAADALGVEHQAHMIKGASASVGGEALRRAASEVEKAGKAGDLKTVTVCLPEMETQFRRLKEAVAREL